MRFMLEIVWLTRPILVFLYSQLTLRDFILKKAPPIHFPGWSLWCPQIAAFFEADAITANFSSNIFNSAAVQLLPVYSIYHLFWFTNVYKGDKFTELDLRRFFVLNYLQF